MGIEKCIWKEVREQDIKEIETPFTEREHLACDDCTGYERKTCYIDGGNKEKYSFEKEVGHYGSRKYASTTH